MLDGVYSDVRIGSFTTRGFDLGFDDKTLFSQVRSSTEGYLGSSAEDVELARRATDTDTGVVTDGHIIENLQVDNACRTLGVADAMAQLS